MNYKDLKEVPGKIWADEVLNFVFLSPPDEGAKIEVINVYVSFGGGVNVADVMHLSDGKKVSVREIKKFGNVRMIIVW